MKENEVGMRIGNDGGTSLKIMVREGLSEEAVLHRNLNREGSEPSGCREGLF